jgi:hypothetical protein
MGTITAINTAALGRDAAVELDEQIRVVADGAGLCLDNLANMLTTAEAGQIHQELGFGSWPEYVADRLKPITKSLSRAELSTLALELHQAGMSVRAIAEATGLSKSTVGRQVSQSGTDGNVIGRDTKRYPRRNGGGGHRGPLDTAMKLRRVGTAVGNITGLEPEDAEKLSEICKLIDEVLASIQPATETK